MKKDTDELIKQLIADRKVRRRITFLSHDWFFHLFFGHYVKFATALFQKEIMGLTEDDSVKLLVVTAFRGSGKSTIMTMSYPLWAVMGKQQKKFVIIFSKTQSQAKTLFNNLKRELESNELLRADLGPFETQNEEWGAYSITIKKYGARIVAASSEQGIRGLRHGEHRPDLIICDDIEDLQSVKTLENRDKTFQWLTGEVIPAGDTTTKVLVVGNLLHEDSVIRRLIEGIKTGKLKGQFREYPLLDQQEQIAWPDKFKDSQAIEDLKLSIGSEVSWQREYLLRIITDEDQIVRPEWIQYYKILPNDFYRMAATGIDLAIAETATADFTAMVSVKVCGQGSDVKIYILPNPVNERLDFPKTVDRAKYISRTLGLGLPTKLFIENVGYQKAFIDQLKSEGYPAEEFKVQGQDKHARLQLTTHLIQAGQILFPTKGAEKLVNQILNFGKERHDDLVDAFCIVVLKIMEMQFKATALKAKYLITEQDLKFSPAHYLPNCRRFTTMTGEPKWEYLGIVIKGGNRENSVIVGRRGKRAKILYKGSEEKIDALADTVIGLAEKNNIPLDRYHILVEKSFAGKQFSDKLSDKLRPHLSYLSFTVDLEAKPEGSAHEFSDLKSQAYFRLKDWLISNGKFMEQENLGDLLEIMYVEEEGKMRIFNTEESIRHGLKIPDVADALMLIFTKVRSEQLHEQYKSTPFHDQTLAWW